MAGLGIQDQSEGEDSQSQRLGSGGCKIIWERPHKEKEEEGRQDRSGRGWEKEQTGRGQGRMGKEPLVSFLTPPPPSLSLARGRGSRKT